MAFKNQFKLNQCTIIVDENTLLFNGDDASSKQVLQPKFVELIHYLAEQYPRVIPRNELIEKIWDGNEYVGEKALTNAIWHLRKCFNELHQPEVIETIRKVGYKLAIEPIWFEQPQESTSRTYTTVPEKNSRPIYASMTIIFVSLIVLVNVVWYLYSKWMPVQEREITSITNEPGSELFVAPSPDGNYVAYAWTDANGATDLYLKHTKLADVPTKKLTHDGLIQGISTWSPSGEYLYFAKKNRPARQCSIIQLHVKALQERPIANCPFSGGYYYMDASPDGNILAFHGRESGHKTSGIYFLYLNDNNKVIRFSCLENCEFKDRDITFSPDSKQVALTRRTGRYSENLFIVDLATGKETQITQEVQDIVGLTWSPNSEQIVFGTQVADIRQGHVHNLITNETFTLNVRGFSYPEFAKQSGELFFQQREEHYHIAKLPLSSEVATSPFPIIKSSVSHNYPDYSNVNKQLVYSSNQSGNYELWTSDLDGNNRVQLTELGLSVQFPKWSNKGDKIAFLGASKTQPGDAFYIYDLSTKRISAIDTGYKSHNRPTWSADDSKLVSAITVAGRTSLYSIDITSGELQKLTRNSGRLGYLNQDDELIYARLSGGLWRKNLTTGKVTQIINPQQLNSIYSWLPTEDGIYFQNRSIGKLLFSKLDFKTNEIKPILQLPTGYISSSANLSYAKESNTLVFPLREIPQSDIKQLTHPMIH